MFNCKKYNSFVNEHNSLKRVDNRISLCSVCNHYAHNECCIGNTFDSRRKLRRKKMCLMSNSIENGDRDPFLTSETFPGIPADSRAPSITIPFYKLDDMKNNTMTFDTMVKTFKKKTTKGLHCMSKRRLLLLGKIFNLNLNYCTKQILNKKGKKTLRMPFSDGILQKQKENRKR